MFIYIHYFCAEVADKPPDERVLTLYSSSSTQTSSNAGLCTRLISLSIWRRTLTAQQEPAPNEFVSSDATPRPRPATPSGQLAGRREGQPEVKGL